MGAALCAVLGRRTAFRLGRFLRACAVLDEPNIPELNGEVLVLGALRRVCLATPGAVVCDIGANVGHWTRRLLVPPLPAGQAPRVFAFEPVDSTRAALVANLAAWGIGGAVEVLPLALAGAPGAATMTVVAPAAGRNSLLPTPGAPTQPVRVTTLAAWAAERGIGGIVFAKCDVEGLDYEVAVGARPLLEAGRLGMLQLEYGRRWVDARRYLRDALDLFRGVGYRVGKLTHLGLMPLDAWTPDLETFTETNLLAWHPRHDADVPPRVRGPHP